MFSHGDHSSNNVDFTKIKKQFIAWRGQYGRFLPKNRQVKILDLGCGYGGMVHWLYNSGYEFVEGIDINRERIDKGIEFGIKNLHHGDANSFLRDKRDFYDVILLIDVLNHLSKDEVIDLFEAIKSSLKSDGTLIVKVANAESPMAGGVRYSDFRREINFNESSLKNLILTIGFKKVGAYPMRPVVHGVKSFVRYFFWRFIEVGLKIYRLIETGSPRGVFTQSIVVVVKK